MRKLYYVLFFLILTISCTKDDGENEVVPSSESGGIIYTSEIVEVHTQNAVVDQYIGFIDNVPLDILRINDSTLVFTVTRDLPLGNVQLTVQELNIAVNYTIQETILEMPVEETIQDYITKLEVSSADITDSMELAFVQEMTASFKNFYSTLSQEDKVELAEYYQANKSLFESSMNGQFKRSTSGFTENVTKCQLAMYGTGVLGGITYLLATPASMKLSVMTGGVTLVFLAKTRNYCKKVAESKIRSIYVKMENLIAEAGKRQSYIEIHDQSIKFIPVTLANRGFEINDINSSNTFIAGVVGMINDFNNDVMLKINEAIAIWNNNAPSFFSFTPYELINIPEKAETEQLDLTLQLFNNMSFSISDNNLEIQTLNYANGGIEVKLKIIDPTNLSNGYVETTLNFIYQDEHNDFSGSFPIRVNPPCPLYDAPVIYNRRQLCENDRPLILIDFECEASYNSTVIFWRDEAFLSTDSTWYPANNHTTTLQSGNEVQGTIEIDMTGPSNYANWGNNKSCSDPQAGSNFLTWLFPASFAFKIVVSDDCGKTTQLIF